MTNILNAVNNVTKNVSSVNGQVDHNKMVTISLSIGVRSLEQLNRLISTLKNIPDVYLVKRKFR
ncbi:GTP pyrophosphokinase, (p)ppGpp synthetase I [Lentilactobacillus farraginis DSM 18382 = JCM 14108]|uniref:GTP pyrophosphokinase, (P)ppGpp synthetase I n=1 Tax=Lentilactobacillus farraginis DSM 18382 = JCM 14108 TaxID=1423743 RepID=X0Q9T0_9LACO|nr:GTP pyrophosphokinase, (p)ppGpp synthetase I [Lentilactobacillus farraginis DSM 18382 = JCM 14108]